MVTMNSVSVLWRHVAYGSLLRLLVTANAVPSSPILVTLMKKAILFSGSPTSELPGCSIMTQPLQNLISQLLSICGQILKSTILLGTLYG
jgi:hypothetical protein